MSEQVKALLEWCAANSILIESWISIQSSDSSGICVYSKDDYIPEGTILVKIPKDVVLSVRTCTLATQIPISLYGLDAQLSLSTALLVELLKGKKSQWYGYIRALPKTIVDLPLFWGINLGGPEDGSDALAWLTGTEAAKILDAPIDNGVSALEEMTNYYHRVAEPLLMSNANVWQDRNESIQPTLNMFYYAFSMVSSRAFLVDAYHGLALVPVADAFNHVVENHVRLESDFNVCPECGWLDECIHDSDETLATSPTFLHNISRRRIYINGGETDHDTYFEMVSNATIPPRSQIYNTYGEELTNAQLLNQYGFILDVNENDFLAWEAIEILQHSKHYKQCNPGSGELQEFFSKILSLFKETSTRSLLNQIELVYYQDYSTQGFRVNSDGRISHHLWGFLFILSSIQYRPLEGILEEQLLKTLELQMRYEGVANDSDTSDDNDRSSGTDHLTSKILFDIACMAVNLCKERKRLIGHPSNKDTDLSVVMEEISSNKLRTQLALSLLISERSILDSCEAGWQALAQVIPTDLDPRP